ncbi:hypothetical protein C8J57DRAFT_1542244 [Mycena rebaudengoi]|nr:hypothetical protein C8J57DRAFT_1542244 [Mycena rebaudengoi]
MSFIARKLNEGHELGDRFLPPQIREMVRKDPELLELTPQDEAKLKAELMAKREVKHRGVRTTNAAAAKDAGRTMKALVDEITTLAERTNMVGFAMFTQGHMHDKSQPMSMQSWGALEFFSEVLKLDPLDVAHRFELWSISRGKVRPNPDSITEMRKWVTTKIDSGLQAIRPRNKKIAMNYVDYTRAIVGTHGVHLSGWPYKKAPFKRMGELTQIGQVRAVRDALASGQCCWVVLSDEARDKMVEEYEEKVESGEIEEKKCQGRSDKGVARKKVAVGGKRVTRAGGKRKRGEDTQSEEEESNKGDDSSSEEEPPRKRIFKRGEKGAKDAKAVREAKAVKEAEAAKAKAAREKAAREKASKEKGATKKRGREEEVEQEIEEEEEEERPKKKPRKTGGNTSSKSGASKPRKAAATAPAADPAPPCPRPQPTPAWKKPPVASTSSASTIARINDVIRTNTGTIAEAHEKGGSTTASTSSKNSVKGKKGKGPPGIRPADKEN